MSITINNENKNKNARINIFYNKTVQASQGWQNFAITWGQFIKDYLSNPIIQKNITVKEIRECTQYSHLTNSELKELRKKNPEKWNLYQEGKNKLAPYKLLASCFVGGSFEGEKRIEANQKNRNLMALDIDKGETGIIQKIEKAFSNYEYYYHTSFSHLVEKPKLRVFFPLEKPITDKFQYSSLVEKFIISHGLSIESDSKVGDCDRASLKYNQVMFLPNKCSNGQYKSKHNKGKLVCLSDYSSIDVPMLDCNVDESKIDTNESKINELISKVESPYDMGDSSIIKQFCMQYDIHAVIDTYLKDIYKRESNDRYTYLQGSQVSGLVVYPDNKDNKAVYAYSWHSTDKLNDGRVHNSVDLLKVHKFKNDLTSTINFCKKVLGFEEKTINESTDLQAINGLDFLDVIHGEIDSYKNLPCYSSGFDSLDNYLNGGFRKYLYVIGAGSSMGKTTFVQQLADNIAKSDNHVMFFSMEQNVLELMTKSISRLTYENNVKSSLSHSEIMEGKKSSNLDSCIEHYQHYASNITYFEADMGTTVISIEKAVSAYIEDKKVKPLVIIDYLQVLGSINDRDDTKKAIEKTVKKLKMITKYLEVPIVVLSSLNRDSYYMPVSYESFKETGGIEYTCDCLIGLQYEAVSRIRTGKKEPKKTDVKELIEKEGGNIDKDGNYYRKLELVGLKNRGGKQTCRLAFDYLPKFNHFKESKDNPKNDFKEPNKEEPTNKEEKFEDIRKFISNGML